MTPAQLSDRIEALVEEATAKYLNGISIEQGKIWRQVSGIIDKIELTADGLIKPTVKNLSLLKKIDGAVEEITKSATFDRKIENFLAQFGEIGAIQNEYFSILEEAFIPNEALFRRIEQSAISLTQESLIGAGIDNELIGPIKEILQVNITSGASFFDVKEQVRKFIVGSEKLGRLESYSGQIARDSLNQFSRAYHESLSQDLGLDWYLYRGGKVADTRPFCADKAGRYFHRTEIEKWPKQNWAGKIPGTNASTIYIYAGGFNCMHHIVAVHTSVVPKADRARIKK